MSKAKEDILPYRFDPKLFADQNRELVGSFPAKGMSRLKQYALSMQSEISVRLLFSSGLYGLPRITGEIKYVLCLRCERCLDKVELTLNPNIEVLAKPSNELISDANNELEFYEYEGNNLELVDLIEDELLLALPLAPKHEDISLCNQDMVAWLASNEEPAEKAENPFAILKR